MANNKFIIFLLMIVFAIILFIYIWNTVPLKFILSFITSSVIVFIVVVMISSYKYLRKIVSRMGSDEIS